MGRDQDEHKTEYDLDHLIQSAYGLNDDQILERMRHAEETVDDSRIPPEAEDGFQRFQEEAKRRRLKPHFADEYAAEKKKEGERKIRGLGPLIRLALAVAILGSVLIMTSISAGAKRSYRYEQSSRENAKGDVAFDNEENKKNPGAMEEAYDKIYQKLGINVLKLGYRPRELKYLKTAISSNYATSYFEYKGNAFWVIQNLKTAENSSNTVSDRKKIDSVHNNYIDIDVDINAAETDSGETEYNARIVASNAYYYIAGIMELDEFKKVVGDLELTE